MFRNLLYLVVGLFLFVSGCSTMRSTAIFRDQKIFAGQSNDSVEKSLGAPDLVGIGPFYQFMRIDPWVSPGRYSIEWIYLGPKESLILGLDFGMVRGIWLVDTAKIKTKSTPIINLGIIKIEKTG